MKYHIIQMDVTLIPKKLAIMREMEMAKANVRIAQAHERCNKAELNGLMPLIIMGHGAN